MAHPLTRFINAVNREYERRVRRASQPPEETAPHQDDGETWDDGEVEIANVPRGTAVNTKPAE